MRLWFLVRSAFLEWPEWCEPISDDVSLANFAEWLKVLADLRWDHPMSMA